MKNDCYFWIIFLVFEQLFDRNKNFWQFFALFGIPYGRRLTSFGIFHLFITFGRQNLPKIVHWVSRRPRTSRCHKLPKFAKICQKTKTVKICQNCPFLTSTVLSRWKTLNFCLWLMNFNRCMLRCLINAYVLHMLNMQSKKYIESCKSVQEQQESSKNVSERFQKCPVNVQERPGTSRNVQERPGTSRNVQEHSGTFPGTFANICERS